MKMTRKPGFLGLIAVGATLLAWGLQRRVNGENAAGADRKWSMTDLRQLSLGPEMSAVVYGMAVVDKRGRTLLYRASFQERVVQFNVADLRAIVLDEATRGKGRRKTNKLAAFAAMEDPAVTCAAPDTAGWDGIEMCIDECGNDKWYHIRIPSHAGACVVLCTLAVDPCTEKNTWEKLTKTHPSNEDKDPLLLVVLVLLVAGYIAKEKHHLHQQRASARRAGIDLG